jgi:hypothetical protein
MGGEFQQGSGSRTTRPRPKPLFLAADLLHPLQVLLLHVSWDLGAWDVACLVVAVCKAVPSGVPTTAHECPI